MLFGWDKLAREEEERIARGIVENRTYGGPWHMEIQPTDQCNLDCFFCSARPYRNHESLPWDVLAPLLKQAALRDLRFLRLSGGGESLIYPSIRPLLDLCGYCGLRLVDVTTNGTTLAALANLLVEVGLDIASISLNEPTAELYARSMRTSERMFHRAVEGIKALRAARDGAPPDSRPQIHLKFFLWKENLRCVQQMYRLGLELGADRIMINSISFLPPDLRMTPEELPSAKSNLLEVIAEDCRSDRPKLTFHLPEEGDLQQFAVTEQARRLPTEFDLMPDVIKDEERCEYCHMGWYSATLAITGAIYPCCNFVGLPAKVMGNIHREPLEAIWGGPAYRRFRREFRRLMLLRGEMEHSCRFDRFIEPMCIARRDCPFAYYLCSSSFYRRVATEMNRKARSVEGSLVHGRNWVLKSAHRFTFRWRAKSTLSQKHLIG